MKYLSNLVTILITFSIVLSSCSTPDKQSTIPNKNNIQNKANTFKAKSLETKPNEDFRIKIISKSEDEPIEITNEYEKPLVSDIEFNTFNYSPEIRKPYFHKALTKAEIKAKRKEARKTWIAWHKERQRKLRQELKQAHKDQRIYQKDVVQLFLSIEDKGSEEYNNLLQEQITLRQELIDQQKGENKALKDQYKAEIGQFKELLIATYPKTDNTNVYAPKDKQPCKIDDAECDPFEDTVIDTEFPEDKDYTYYKEDDDTAYKYDNTYVDGRPYFDSYVQEDSTNYSPEINPTYFDNLQDNTEENPQGFSAKKFKTLAAACQNVVVKTERDKNNINKVITSIAFKDQSCKTAFTSITEVESLPDSCANKNKISFIGKGVSFKAEIPIQLLTKTIVTRLKIRDANGIETTLVEKVTTLPDVGSVKIAPVERPAGATVQSLTEKNVYSIDNTTGEFINFKLKDSSGATKMEGSCLSMTKGTIDIFKKDLDTDDYKLEFYRASNPNFIATKKDVKITNAKVKTFMTNGSFKAEMIASFNKRSESSYDLNYIRSSSNSENYTKPLSNTNTQLSNNCSSKEINEFIANSEKYNLNNNAVPQQMLKNFKSFSQDFVKDVDTKFTFADIENCKTNEPLFGATVDLTREKPFNINMNPMNNSYAYVKIIVFNSNLSAPNLNKEIFSKKVKLERGYKHIVVFPFASNNSNFFSYFLSGYGINYDTTEYSNHKIIIKVESDNTQYGETDLPILSTFLNWVANITTIAVYDTRPYITTQSQFSGNIKMCRNENDEYGKLQRDVLGQHNFTENSPILGSGTTYIPGNIKPSPVIIPSTFPSIFPLGKPKYDVTTFVLPNNPGLIAEIEKQKKIASQKAIDIVSKNKTFSTAAGSTPNETIIFVGCNLFKEWVSKKQSEGDIKYELGKGKPVDLKVVVSVCSNVENILTISGNAIITSPDNFTVKLPEIKQNFLVKPQLEPNTLLIDIPWYGRNIPYNQESLDKMAGPNYTKIGKHKLKVNFTVKKGDETITDINDPKSHLEKEFEIISEYPNYVINNIPKEPRLLHIKERHMSTFLTNEQYNVISKAINQYSLDIKSTFVSDDLKKNIRKRDKQLELLYNNLRAYIINDDPYDTTVFVPKSINCFPIVFSSNDIYKLVKSVANFESIDDKWSNFSASDDEPRAYVTGSRDGIDIQTRIDNKKYGGYGVISTAYPLNSSGVSASQRRDLIMLYYLKLVTSNTYSNEPIYLEKSFHPDTTKLKTLTTR